MPLSPAEVVKYLQQLKTTWTVSDSKKLSREFTFKSFEETMLFVKKVAEIARSEDHHPDIRISYSKATIELTTHAIGGLSENDFIVASKIEEVNGGGN